MRTCPEQHQDQASGPYKNFRGSDAIEELFLVVQRTLVPKTHLSLVSLRKTFYSLRNPFLLQRTLQWKGSMDVKGSE